MTKPYPSDPTDPLSELITDAVSDIEPRDAFASIRARTKESTMTARRPWLFGAGGAVLATAAVLTAFAVLGQNAPAPNDPDAAGSPATATESGEPSKEPTGGGEDPEQTPAGVRVAVPAYYLGITPQGPRLFREFHRLTVADDLAGMLTAAVNESVAGAPLDPDYASAWPAGTTATAALTGDVLTVDVSGEAPLRTRPAGMTAAEASLSVEQLVYAVHAGLASFPDAPELQTSPDRTPVQFLLNGGRTDQLLGVPVSEPVAAAPQLDVLAMVNLTTPEEGAVVSGSMAVEGRASSFEATVPWEIRRGDRVVDRGYFTAEGYLERLYPFAGTVDVSRLAPGEYVFAATTSDPSDGEGFGPTEDTRRIVVE